MQRGKGRRNHSAAYKAKIALAASRGERTLAELSQLCGVHPSQIAAWKRPLLDHAAELFERGAVDRAAVADTQIRELLYQQIGQLKVELDWLKKSQAASVETRRTWVARKGTISMARQCELLGIHRSGVY